MDTHQPRPVTPQPPQGSGGGGFSAILTVFLSFIAIFAMLAFALASDPSHFLHYRFVFSVIPSSSTIMNGFSILHQVPEGHVGVYWRGGALLKTINDPGFHLKLPFITRYEPVQVSDIPCGTKGGVMINFEKIKLQDVALYSHYGFARV
uniref:Band 7 domain-containing protein n=1 Tax=Quercus lobata TaxID=97700 RepID=A0A7N2KQQ0_QUELO